jgi:putative endonuclease
VNKVKFNRMNHRQNLGKWGETLAANWLSGQGLQILARNVRTPYGELDVIARQKDVLVFVEVKTRTNTEFGMPETAITPEKQKHLHDSAIYYLQEKAPDFSGDWRVDVIAILTASQNDGPEIYWIQNALQSE